MKHIAIIAALALLVVGCAPCIEGVGEITSERRVQTPFTGIEVGGNINLVIEQTSANSNPYIVVHAQENILPSVKAEIKGDVLHVETEGCVTTSEPIKVVVVTPQLTSIEYSGSGEVLCYMMFATPEMRIEQSGTGEITFRLMSQKTDIVHSGSGRILLNGATNELNIECTGSGKLELDTFRAENVSIEHSGSGDVSVQSHSSLDVQLSGSGNVLYRGEPQNLQQENTGSGNIRRAS